MEESLSAEASWLSTRGGSVELLLAAAHELSASALRAAAARLLGKLGYRSITIYTDRYANLD
jgi:hypothetical protein